MENALPVIIQISGIAKLSNVYLAQILLNIIATCKDVYAQIISHINYSIILASNVLRDQPGTK